jgi:hypothetical protein
VELSHFVEPTFGEEGCGSHANEYIQHDRFGILDARTAEDGTLEFVVKESMLPAEAAQARVAWRELQEAMRH